MAGAHSLPKLDISLKIAQQVGVDQLVAIRVVQATLDVIIAALATEGRLELRDFGVFEVRVTSPGRPGTSRPAPEPWCGRSDGGSSRPGSKWQSRSPTVWRPTNRCQQFVGRHLTPSGRRCARIRPR